MKILEPSLVSRFGSKSRNIVPLWPYHQDSRTVSYRLAKCGQVLGHALNDGP